LLKVYFQIINSKRASWRVCQDRCKDLHGSTIKLKLN
jgi:hypothetical protein